MIAAQSTLRSIALEQPATIRVFEHFHLDYCCGGNRPLGEVCTQQGIALDTILASLNEAANTGRSVAPDFAESSLAELTHYIVQVHHGYIRNELPRLLPMAERAAGKHGPTRPELVQIHQQLTQLADELFFHLQKEEQILFPYVKSLEQSRNNDATAPEACFASVESPIQTMIHEHEVAGALLDNMRKATENFTPWNGACPTLVGLYDGLDAFERDLHRHVHLENNLLFPRAIALEAEVLAAQ